MKLVRFSKGAEPARAGVITGQRVVALDELVPGAPSDMCDIIADWDRLKSAIASEATTREGTPLAEVTLEAPVARPGKILAIGLNYADHIKESGLETPKEQVWFSKHINGINGPFAPVEMPKASEKLDYEVELVAVIGRKGRHISRADAPLHVFGYTVGNDVSVRDWQLRTPQWTLGKSFDTHCPIGPAIVTADEVGDPHTLGIRCLVNGETRQSSNTSHLVFNLWDQIAYVSQAMTLQPGDLIFTGTPGGVGIASRPPRLLTVGDVVRCEIDKIGAIENKIVAEV